MWRLSIRLFRRALRRILVDEVVDAVLLFNLITTLVGYYFDPTTPARDLRYCRQVLMHRPGRDGPPPWARPVARATAPPASSPGGAVPSGGGPP